MNSKFTILLFLATLVACDEPLEYRDVLYFTGTETNETINFTIDAPSDLGVSVTSSTRVDHDVTVGIEMKPELVDAYNAARGTKYEFLPAESYALSTKNLSLSKGAHVSESAILSITSLDNFEEGVTYCVPITITNVDGGLSVSEPSRTVYVIINRTIITRAVDLAGNNHFGVDFESDPSLSSLNAITMECRVYVNRFQTSNPYISTIMGIEEGFLLRFGDVSVENNQLQLAGALVGGKKYPVTSNTRFSTERWYHVAVVYNGSTISLYVDGVLDSYTDTEGGTVDLTYNFNGNFYLGQSVNGRRLNGYMSEARVWSRALSTTELANNLCYVDPASEGLIAYWRMNEEQDNGELLDLTGHGYNAVPRLATTQWVEGVRCPN